MSHGGLLHRVTRRFRTAFTAPLPYRDFGTYDGYWETREAAEPDIHKRWDVAIAKIPDGATVLDVGCGSGGFMTYLLKHRPNVQVRGTDISDVAVKAAQARGLDAFVADLTREPLDRTYDYVTCFEVIEHIHEAEAVLIAMRDATKRQLIMSLPNFGHMENRIRLALFGRFPNTNLILHAKEHIRHWTVKDFTHWVELFGLRVVSVDGHIGSTVMPWRSRPAMFAMGVVYVLEPVH